jgi:plasmid stabilization system protein ParE
MGFRISYTAQATDDLAGIIRYIGRELSNPKAAEHFYRSVKEKLELLCEHPYMFPLYHNDKLSAQGFRFIVAGSFLIFYLVDDDSSVVNIVRILYGKQDVVEKV